jgi:hypothetical protein
LGHLAESAKLADRLRQLATARLQLMRALLNFLFQAGIGLLQLSRHGVELVGKRFELVSGLDCNPLRKITAAKACCAGLQGPNRANHAAGKEHAGKHGEQERGEQHIAEPLQRRVERRIGFLGRQLDEHQPAEWCHPRISGEHLATLDILRLLHRLGRVAGAAGARRAHLREPRHVGVA